MINVDCWIVEQKQNFILKHSLAVNENNITLGDTRLPSSHPHKLNGLVLSLFILQLCIIYDQWGVGLT